MRDVYYRRMVVRTVERYQRISGAFAWLFERLIFGNPDNSVMFQQFETISIAFNRILPRRA
jgi:hypothetical protein